MCPNPINWPKKERPNDKLKEKGRDRGLGEKKKERKSLIL